MSKRTRLIVALGILAVSIAALGTTILAQSAPKPTGQDDGGPIAPALGL